MSFYLQEDGVSRYLLEDGTSLYLIDDSSYQPVGVNAAIFAAIIGMWQPPPLTGEGFGTIVSSSTNEPPRISRVQQLVQANQSWQVDWRAQQASEVAPLIPAVAVTFVPNFAYSSNVLLAWQDQYKYGTYSSNVIGQTASDQPPSVKPEVPKAYWQWIQDWKAQQAPEIASLIPPPVASQVPYVQYDPVWTNYSWVLDWRTQYSGKLVQPSSGDNPPGVKPEVAKAYWSWISQPTWNSQTEAPNASWNIPFTTVDNPPPNTNYYTHYVINAWQVTWGVQTAPPNASWNFPAVVIPNVPPTSTYNPYVINSWQTLWNSQTAAPNASWNIGPVVDSPIPIKGLYYNPQVIASWQSTWNAQTEAANAGWNVPLATVDNPPPQTTYFWPNTWTQWQINWVAQRANLATPPTNIPAGNTVFIYSGVSEPIGVSRNNASGVSKQTVLLTPLGGNSYTVVTQGGVSTNKTDSVHEEWYVIS